MDQVRNARVAAISMATGGALAKLLRAHGRAEHAENIEVALDEVAAIIAATVGEGNLTAAMDWVTTNIWDHDALYVGSVTRH